MYIHFLTLLERVEKGSITILSVEGAHEIRSFGFVITLDEQNISLTMSTKIPSR